MAVGQWYCMWSERHFIPRSFSSSDSGQYRHRFDVEVAISWHNVYRCWICQFFVTGGGSRRLAPGARVASPDCRRPEGVSQSSAAGSETELRHYANALLWKRQRMRAQSRNLGRINWSEFFKMQLSLVKVIAKFVKLWSKPVSGLHFTAQTLCGSRWHSYVVFWILLIFLIY